MTAVPKPVPTLKEPRRLQSKYRGIPQPVKKAVFARDNLTCQWCRVPGGALDAHHRLRRSQGGSDQGRFLVSVHRLCHDEIHRNVAEAKRRGFLVSSVEELERRWT